MVVVDSDSFDSLLEWEFLTPVCMIATVVVVVVDSESFDSLLDSEFLTSVCNYCVFDEFFF